MLPEATSPSLLKNPAFRRLCSQMLASATAVYAIYFASMVLVEEMTHSSTQMGLMIFASTLPGLLLGPWAGVVVDRHERIGVLVTSNVLRAVVSLGFLVAVRFLEPPLLLPAIYLCNFAQGALNQFVAAAEGATIPRLVRPKQLLGANSLFNAALLAAQGAGLVMLAPLLLKLGGPQAVAWAAILLGLVSIPLSTSLPREEMVPPARERQTLARAWAELKAGWQFTASDRLTSLATFQLVLASSVSLILSTLAPGLVARVLGLRVEDAAYMLVPVGVGLGLGMALLGWWGNRQPSESWSSGGLLILGGALTLLPLLHRLEGLWWLLFLLVTPGMGFGFALVFVPAGAILQKRPPERMRGRVIATRLVLSNAASTLPLPLAGALADWIGIRQMLLLMALIVLGAGAGSIHHTRTVSFAPIPAAPGGMESDGQQESHLR